MRPIARTFVIILILLGAAAAGYSVAVLSHELAEPPPRARTRLTDPIIDPRSYWVSVQRVYVAPRWELAYYQYQDETESGGTHHIYVNVLDENERPMPNTRVWFKWPDAAANEVVQKTDMNGATNFALWPPPCYPDQGQVGAYYTYVEDAAVSDSVSGMCLPANRHVSYILTFRRQLGPPTLVPTGTPVPGTPTYLPSVIILPPEVSMSHHDVAVWLRELADQLDK